ncbi:MAG: ribosomal RNA small subunit methyltransferase A [Butyricimonas paravirosa]
MAERISASQEQNIRDLGVFYKHLRHQYLFTVGEQVFDPPPKVKSAVIRLIRNKREKLDCDEKLFFNIVKSGFNQRRKTLRNSLKSIISPDFASETLSLRPEQLSVEDFITLCKEIQQANK